MEYSVSSGPVVDHPVQGDLPSDVLSNCYRYTVFRYPNLPSESYILGHLSATGNVVVFYYKKSGLYHFAVADSATSTMVSETNYHRGEFDRRDVSGDSAVVGRFSLKK